MTTDNSVEIIDPKDNGHSVSVDGLPEDALRAIIGKLNERSQKATRSFNKGYDIQVEDIKQLIDKIYQEFSGRKIISTSATVSLFLSKGRRHDFRSWDEFAEFDTSMNQTTRSISVEVTVDILDGNNQSPERYQCQVSVQNNPTSLGFIIGPLHFAPADQPGIPPVPIAATVEFNNYVVGKNLLNTIDEWEASLKRAGRGLAIKLRDYSQEMRRLILVLAVLSGVGFSHQISGFLPSSAELNSNLQDWLAISAFSLVIFGYVGELAGRYAERFIDRQRNPRNIVITKGDENAEAKRLSRNKGYLARASIGVGIVVLQIATAVFAEPIIKAIGF